MQVPNARRLQRGVWRRSTGAPTETTWERGRRRPGSADGPSALGDAGRLRPAWQSTTSRPKCLSRARIPHCFWYPDSVPHRGAEDLSRGLRIHGGVHPAIEPADVPAFRDTADLSFRQVQAASAQNAKQGVGLAFSSPDSLPFQLTLFPRSVRPRHDQLPSWLSPDLDRRRGPSATPEQRAASGIRVSVSLRSGGPRSQTLRPPRRPSTD